MILHRFPLGARIAFFVFLAELLLLGGFGGGAFYYYRERFQQLFDDTLRANAEAVAAFLEKNSLSGKLELAMPEERENRFIKNKRPDVYAILDKTGGILFSSSNEFKIPKEFTPGQVKDETFMNLRHKRYAYRGVCLRTRLHQDNSPVDYWIVFAQSRRRLDEDQREIVRGLLWAMGSLLVLSIPLAWGVSYKGLRPLRQVTQEISNVRETTLHHRLKMENLPRDLSPLVRSVNRLLEHLEGAFEREKQFSADAAHELRTPISTLKAGVQAALLSPRNPDEDTETLQDLLTDVDRLEQLCESLLLIASAERNAATDTQPLEDWLADVQEVVDTFRSRTEAGQCSLSLEIKTPPAFNKTQVISNGFFTRRIATNFLENALRHGGPIIRVEVGVWPTEEGRFFFAVEDNGPGIAPGDEAQLFKRFFRSDRARSQVTGGAGLGLAICRAVAESAGGTIHYERPGATGSRFVWTLAQGVKQQKV